MVKIIENSKSTKLFKYKLLSQLIPEIHDWNGEYFNDLFCHAVFSGHDLPQFEFKKSDKSNGQLFEDALNIYTQDFLGKDLKVEVNFAPEMAGFSIGDGCEMGIWLEPETNKSIIRGKMWWSAAGVLDELIEEPYDEKIQRNIVFKALGIEYEKQPFDKNTLESRTFRRIFGEQSRHVRIFKILKDFRKNGLIRWFTPRFERSVSGEPQRVFLPWSEATSLFLWSVDFETTEKFAKAWEEFKKESRKTKEEREKARVKAIELFLSRDGDLYREPKKGHCYEMKEKEGRHNIVKYFVKNKVYNYRNTSKIAEALNKNTKTLLSEIGKINGEVKMRLKIKDRILESKAGSGFRINPKYKITPIR